MIGSAVEGSGNTSGRIANAAYNLFVVNGYHGTSMRMIAREAGLSSVSGIYNHFLSKEDIFAHVVTEFHPLVRVMESIGKTRARTQQGLLRSMAKNMIESLIGDPGMLNLMLIEFVEHQGAHMNEIRSVFHSRMMEMVQMIRSKKGRLRRIDAETLSQSLLGFVFSRVFLGWILASQDNRDPRALRRHVRLYLNGVLRIKRKP